RGDRAGGVAHERPAHPTTHGGGPVHRAIPSFDEVPMEGRVRGFHERIADDLRGLDDSRQGIIPKREPESESGGRKASNSREAVADELAVRDVLPAKVFHWPSKRPPNSFERRSDFGAAALVRPGREIVATHKNSGHTTTGCIRTCAFRGKPKYTMT